MSATCRSCNAPIVWARTPAGKPIPLDAEPSAAGNLRCAEGVATVVPERERRPSELLHVAHFATCPQAASFRKR